MKTALRSLTALLLMLSLTLNAGFSAVDFHAGEASWDDSTEVLRAAWFTSHQPAETAAEIQYQPVTPVLGECRKSENVVREPWVCNAVNRLVAVSCYIIPSADGHTLVFPFHGFW